MYLQKVKVRILKPDGHRKFPRGYVCTEYDDGRLEVELEDGEVLKDLTVEDVRMIK
jgi:hypothetical protein